MDNSEQDNNKKPKDSFRTSQTTPLKNALNELLNVYKLKGKTEESHIITSWRRLMGNAIANRTTKIYIYENKIYIQINSAPLKNELMMAKSKIIEIISQEIEDDRITDVVFL